MRKSWLWWVNWQDYDGTHQCTVRVGGGRTLLVILINFSYRHYCLIVQTGKWEKLYLCIEEMQVFVHREMEFLIRLYCGLSVPSFIHQTGCLYNLYDVTKTNKNIMHREMPCLHYCNERVLQENETIFFTDKLFLKKPLILNLIFHHLCNYLLFKIYFVSWSCKKWKMSQGNDNVIILNPA